MLLLSACGEEAPVNVSGKTADASSPHETQTVKATVMHFREAEPGIEPYTSRMIVTPDFLRMDEGRDEGDYLLYDRRTRGIHSVTHEDRTVLDIPFHEVGITPPYALERVKKQSVDEAAPTVGGRKPVQQKDFVNARLCMETVSAPGLLDDARKALREYREALAGEQARNLYKTPKELQDPCMLSNLIFHPGKGLEEGFPLYERNEAGATRELLDFERDKAVSTALFELPKGYRHYQIQVQPGKEAPVQASETPEAKEAGAPAPAPAPSK
ncbi:MAG: hypothetical protein D6717_04245 [Gammaproteobacteria bacterium]|nr:MAG: hypothetical protein D6717_04245 [Gammaproteobacteria bacterium]